MSHVLSLRVPDEQFVRLQRIARRLGRSPSETGSIFLEEALRRAEFGLIEFRDSPVGRQAYLQGSRLAVWEVVALVRSFGGDTAAAAKHLEWPEMRAQAAMNYAAAFPAEIDAAINDDEAYDLDAVVRMLPQAKAFHAESETA
ncbi:MAG: transcriptional regulator [Capsulimonadaceae bacterium]